MPADHCDRDHDERRTLWQRGRTGLGWLPYLWAVILAGAILAVLIGRF